MSEASKLAAQENAVVEAFVAGAISGRNMERERLYDALVTYEGISVDYEHYIKVEAVLEMLSGGDLGVV
jgi:hypothetical protein